MTTIKDPKIDTQLTTGSGSDSTGIPDGSNVAQGAKADAPATDDQGAWSQIALQKRANIQLSSLLGRLAALLERVPFQTSDRMPVATQKFSGEDEQRDLMKVIFGASTYGSAVPAGTVAGTLAGKLKKPTSNSGSTNDRLLAGLVFVTDEANCQVTLIDGSGVSGAFNEVIFPNNMPLGMHVIQLLGIPSRDGGWSAVTGTGVRFVPIGDLS